MKKRTFLLMEVLIAFLIVGMCIVPLIREPLGWFKTEISKLETMENERIADWTFSEVKEMLLKNEISWEKLPKYKETTHPFPLPDTKLQLPGCKEKAISRSFTIYGKGKKKGHGGEEIRQLHVKIFLGEKQYIYRVPVQKKPMKAD